jgi:rhomboid protease GluP
MPLSPKLQFRLNRYRNRMRYWKASAEDAGQAVFTEHKMCPACRALVDRKARQCEFCGQPLKVIGTGPVARLLSRVVPTDVSATAWLLLFNLMMFAVELSLSHGLSPTNAVTLRLGDSIPWPYMVLTGQYWRLCTAIFLHGGLLHIFFNMWVLFDVGPIVEQLFGEPKFVSGFVLTGVCGYLLSSRLGHVSLGASGAIFGLLGMLFAYGLRRGSTASQMMRSQFGRWIVYMLIFSLLPGIDMAAHIGGLVSGVAFGYLIGDMPPVTEPAIRFWRAIELIAVLAVAASFVLMIRAPQLQ